ncbi:serine protease [Streptomyces sp. 130]|uniref:serine protease n=1 Tax=Streptomyces sp. 130 TaxID=2591006 RepID=UPI00117C6DD4|nr:serine protease [Streptomyces sp. 130]TRV71236.1 serine protease [Streptomyces sp. 130]
MSLALSTTPAPAVSGGQDVQRTNGYTVAVLAPVIMCSGALIDSRHVVTTATCINYLEPGDVEVYVGSNKYYADGLTKAVSKIDTPQSLNLETYEANIAVLTLEPALTPEEMSKFTINPVPRATTLPSVNELATVTGYGATDSKLTLPDVMQRAQLRVYSRTLCNQLKHNKLTATMFCAGDPTGVKDLCPADQGAPLVYDGKLVGIYSWGCSCGLAAPNPSSPVFTSIPSFRAWIDKVVNGTA